MKTFYLFLFGTLLLLTHFSCTEDLGILENEARLTNPSNSSESLQSTERREQLCQSLDYFYINQPDFCSATLHFGINGPYFGEFVIEVLDLSKGTKTEYYTSASPFQVSKLEACTFYQFRITHVTDECVAPASILQFQTVCEACTRCKVICKPLNYFFINNITTTSAETVFGFDRKTCGMFSVQLINNASDEGQYFTPATNPLALSNLMPCTSYTISVSLYGDDIACSPEFLTFTTACEPCEPEAAQVDAYISTISSSYDLIQTQINNQNSTDGYINITDPILEIFPDEDYGFGLCWLFNEQNEIGEVDLHVWIDFDENGVFDSDNLIYSIYAPETGDLCVGGTLSDAPPEKTCFVKGRAILKLNAGDTIDDPCEDIASGQIVDFLVNVGNDCF